VSDTLSQLEPEEFERLRKGLIAMALRALGDLDQAESVAQEALSRTVVALRQGRFREGQSLGAFVRGIARHVIADIFRDRASSSPTETQPDALEHQQSVDALAQLISREERDSVHSALARLSDNDRQIIEMSFFQGLTPAEIADRLQESAERIRKRKSRALARLRDAFLADPSGGHESP